MDQKGLWKKIVFGSDRDGSGFEVYTMNTSGSDPLTRAPNITSVILVLSKPRL